MNCVALCTVRYILYHTVQLRKWNSVCCPVERCLACEAVGVAAGLASGIKPRLTPGLAMRFCGRGRGGKRCSSAKTWYNQRFPFPRQRPRTCPP
jgi:hypothetical protein